MSHNIFVVATPRLLESGDLAPDTEFLKRQQPRLARVLVFACYRPEALAIANHVWTAFQLENGEVGQTFFTQRPKLILKFSDQCPVLVFTEPSNVYALCNKIRSLQGKENAPAFSQDPKFGEGLLLPPTHVATMWKRPKTL